MAHEWLVTLAGILQSQIKTLKHFGKFCSLSSPPPPLLFALFLQPRNFSITCQHYRGKGTCIGVSRIFVEDCRTNSLKQCPIHNGRCCSRIKILFRASLGKLLAKLKAAPFQPVYSRTGGTRKNGGPERGTEMKREVPSSPKLVMFFLVRLARFACSQDRYTDNCSQSSRQPENEFGIIILLLRHLIACFQESICM